MLRGCATKHALLRARSSTEQGIASGGCEFAGFAVLAGSLRNWLVQRSAARADRSLSDDSSLDLELPPADILWALGSLAALHRIAFDAELVLRELPSPPLYSDALVRAARSLGFRIRQRRTLRNATGMALPGLVLLKAPGAQPATSDQTATPAPGSDAAATPGSPEPPRLALLVRYGPTGALIFRAGTNQPVAQPLADFAREFTGVAFEAVPVAAPLSDPDGATAGRGRFGFRWFIPELFRHRSVWRDVLVASFLIQCLALGTPLFTQLVIDKVVVHHTQSTLLVIAIGMGLFLVFSSLLTWLRQYLVLHTGNRVDAVLGASVFDHLLKLPTRYFEARPTGVITARLRGVENIREFIASAAITLVLDLPFLFIFVAIMFAYSVLLTAVTLGIVAVIVALSLAIAPLFRNRLNEQFLIGARNQAFATEFVAGLETVKSLQMEPQVRARYNEYLAEYLRSGFTVRQIANTYNVLASALEQMLAVLVLVIGATLVMSGSNFTIGMLVAFQMFATRVSQPLLRIVGLWQQFQQASLSVVRLGDIMNADPEPYSLTPQRVRAGRGVIDIESLGFRYGDNLPFLFRGLHLRIEPGRVIALMGASGSGKSTLAKLLQGLYPATEGAIKLDGLDIRYLAANELRLNFGVVPQDTTLFSGSVYENLLFAHPHATFAEIVNACRIAEIHEAIEQLPQGYQTPIGERGVGLSGGQKQRIAIARALLKRPKVLIFDEATSSLDVPTAEHFCTTVNQLKGQVTIVFIAHSLPKTLQVDEIVRIGAAPGGAIPEPRVAARQVGEK